MRITFHFEDSTTFSQVSAEDYFDELGLEPPEPGFYGTGTGICERLSAPYYQSDIFSPMFLELELAGVQIES